MNICFDCWLQIYFCVLFFMKGLGLGKILKESMSGCLFPSPEQVRLISIYELGFSPCCLSPQP